MRTIILEEIYREVVDELQIVKTQNEFSKLFGMAPSWYSSTASRKRDLTVEMLYRIKTILHDIALETHAEIEIAETDEDRQAYEAGQQSLFDLCNRIQIALDQKVAS